MRMLAFTDFHDERSSYNAAINLISKEKPDLAVIAGDIANVSVPRAKSFLDSLGETGALTVFVPGNMDDPKLAEWRDTERVRCLHAKYMSLLTFGLMGLGGGPEGPFGTPFEYTETEADQILTDTFRQHATRRLILVSHCPPKDTKIDRLPSGLHVGSSSVRQFVERNQPVLVVSGHVHEAQGLDRLGDTVVVNTGPALSGNYAEIMIEESVSVHLRKF